jgi:curved DNA-binding protein CbpA
MSSVMPPRPSLPSDDLYARLGIPRDASPEAIDLAWRGLLRKHHPDIAGPDALELAKRINIAHDWLSDPELRRRYDHEHGDGIRSGRSPRGPGRTDRPAAGWRPPRREPTKAELVAAVIERSGRLTRDELDRLALAEPAPIAFLATLRRFVPPELDAVIERAERAAIANLPPAARRDLATRDAVVGQLADLVLGDILEALLGDPAGPRARERLTRGWDAAVGQPRYGPATGAIGDLLERLRALTPEEVRSLATTGTRERLGTAPWPRATSPEEDDALRVSSELASADAAAAFDGIDGVGERHTAAARRAAGRVAHLLVLRHAFPAREFDRHAAPWLGTLVPRLAPWGARVGWRTASD